MYFAGLTLLLITLTVVKVQCVNQTTKKVIVPTTTTQKHNVPTTTKKVNAPPSTKNPPATTGNPHQCGASILEYLGDCRADALPYGSEACGSNHDGTCVYVYSEARQKCCRPKVNGPDQCSAIYGSSYRHVQDRDSACHNEWDSCLASSGVYGYCIKDQASTKLFCCMYWYDANQIVPTTPFENQEPTTIRPKVKDSHTTAKHSNNQQPSTENPHQCGASILEYLGDCRTDASPYGYDACGPNNDGTCVYTSTGARQKCCRPISNGADVCTNIYASYYRHLPDKDSLCKNEWDSCLSSPGTYGYCIKDQTSSKLYCCLYWYDSSLLISTKNFEDYNPTTEQPQANSRDCGASILDYLGDCRSDASIYGGESCGLNNDGNCIYEIYGGKQKCCRLNARGDDKCSAIYSSYKHIPDRDSTCRSEWQSCTSSAGIYGYCIKDRTATYDKFYCCMYWYDASQVSPTPADNLIASTDSYNRCQAINSVMDYIGDCSSSNYGFCNDDVNHPAVCLSDPYAYNSRICCQIQKRF